MSDRITNRITTTQWFEPLIVPPMPTSTKDFYFTSPFLEISKHNLSFIDVVRDVKFNFSKRLNKITTTVLFEDGTKATVAPKDGESFDPKAGIEQAILKRFCGLSRTAYKKWLDKMAESGEKLLRDISQREIKDQTISYKVKGCLNCLHKDANIRKFPCSECFPNKTNWEPKTETFEQNSTDTGNVEE